MATKDKLVNLEDLKAVYDHGTELLEEKADQIGSYPDLIAGTADNLLSSSYQTDSTPYILRRTPYGARERGSIVGGSIVWNQLAPLDMTNWGKENVTPTVTDTNINIVPTSSASSLKALRISDIATNHVYFFAGKIRGDGTNEIRFGFYNLASNAILLHFAQAQNVYLQIASIYKPTERAYFALRFPNAAPNTATADGKDVQLIDLTLMFGPTVADYIYAQEQATAGAGVALAKAWAGITADNYPYDPGSIKSVAGLTAHKTTGFNQWDEEWEAGSISRSTGQNADGSTRIRSKNYIPVIQGQAYYIQAANQTGVLDGTLKFFLYDSNRKFLDSPETWYGNASNRFFTVPEGVSYIRFIGTTNRGPSYIGDICINISDPAKNGTYEPYTAHTYPLDSSLTLRGRLKLDGDNLYYDGDIYPPSGEVTRRYGVVDLGTLNWSYNNADGNQYFFANVAGKALGNFNILCDKYALTESAVTSTMTDKEIKGHATSRAVFIKDSAYTDAAAFKTAMSGAYLVYELAEPTTEQAEPYTELQLCDPNGTEEWVGASMPVGHDTKYYEDLKGKIEDIPDAPSADGTYTLKVTVSNGVATYSWG